MNKDTQLLRWVKNWWIGTLVGIVAGFVAALSVSAHIQRLWDASSPVRTISVGGLWVIFTVFFTLSTVFLRKNWKKYGHKIGLTAISLGVLVVGIFWLARVFPLPNAVVPESVWKRVTPIADDLFFSVGLGFILSSLLIALIGIIWTRWGEAFLKAIFSLHYGNVFVGIFVGGSLLFLQGVKDFSSLDRQFWKREKLISAHENFRYRQLKDRLFEQTIVGRDNWLVYTGEDSLNDFQYANSFTKEEQRTIQKKLDRLTKLLSDRGIQFLVVIAPNKNTIYPEYLPVTVPHIGQRSRLDDFLEYQHKYGKTKILDLRPILLEARQEKQVFYRTDTHWNPYGAFYAYQEILKALNIVPLTFEDYEINYTGIWKGDLAQLASISAEEQMFKLSPLNPPQVTSRKYYQNTNLWVDIFFNENKDLPKLLIFRDSFSIELIPYFLPHFSQVISYRYMPEDVLMFSEVNPDIVIIEITERYLLEFLRLPE